MARILVSALPNLTFLQKANHDSFVECFINVLLRMGNDVLDIKINNFENSNETLKDSVSQNSLLEQVKLFNPDLIITFNNAVIRDIVKCTNCPILVYASDSAAYFHKKDLIKIYAERYFFINPSNDTILSIQREFDFIKKDRILLFGQATDFNRLDDVEQDIKLSFIGSLGNWSNFIPEYFEKLRENHKDDLSFLNKTKDKFYETIDALRSDKINCKIPDFPEMSYKNIFKARLISALTSNIRIKLLDVLSGCVSMKIYSDPRFIPKTFLYAERIFRYFDYSPCTTFQDLMNVYNRSIISLSLPHFQAIGGFSWRVCDIMATRAILLTNKQKDLESLTRGIVCLPMYESAAEAKMLLRKFLKDSQYRMDLVNLCNIVVNKRCRFEPKFKELESVLNLKFDNAKYNGSYSEAHPQFIG